MNANELAEALDDLDLISGYEVVSKAQAMLRQQQAEIEALKKEAALQRLSDFTQEADNEPVAWMLLGLEDRKPKLINLQVIEHLEGTWIPLYTHPAKTLTDEEIEEVYKAVEQDFYLTESKKSDGGWRNFPVELARAILRKAQGK